jgi:4-cresol dehydrogenase (hydroxylating) flavoprotein subunit
VSCRNCIDLQVDCLPLRWLGGRKLPGGDDVTELGDRTRLLPPGVSESDFDRAVEGFTATLGSERVLTSEGDLTEFRDPFSFSTWDDYLASAVVMPETVEEIQEVVRIANERRIPLWTHAAGMNNGYGGPAPRLKGSVIVSLRRMNRVLEINEDSAYAVVEPGVRWFDLYDAVRAGGHRLMVSIPDLGWGSVVGNTLENGATYLPTGADMAAGCGMEVVLANGEVLRTGMGAMPGNQAWHVYKRSLGPSLDTFFMQSNYGIVTKMGVWLMPYPECYMPLWLRVWSQDDLHALVETLRVLMLDRTIENVPQIWNTIASASVMSSRALWYEGEEPIPDSTIDRIAREMEVGRWMMRFALYGDEAVVDHKFRKVKEAFERISAAEVWGQKYAPEELAEIENPHERVQAGVPNLELNNMTGWYGGEEGGHIGFSPVARLTGPDAVSLRDLIRGLVEREAKLDYAAVLIPTNARSFIHVTMVIFDTKSEAEARRAYETSRLLVRECAKHGYGEYRAHLDFMDIASEQYSFGDHAYKRLTETIKDAVDPNGILSPGKQGIWPKALRSNGDGRPG